MAQVDLEHHRGTKRPPFIFRHGDFTILKTTEEALRARDIDSGFVVVRKSDFTDPESLTEQEVKIDPWVKGFEPEIFAKIARAGIKTRDSFKGGDEAQKWEEIRASIFQAVDELLVKH